MTGIGARVTAHRLALPTCLLAGSRGIFAVARSMAILLAHMGTAFQSFSANLPTANVCQPAGLIFQRPLATKTHFLGQKRALRAILLICMAVVLRLRMAAGFGSFTGERTRWRLRSAGQWRIQDRSTTVTRDLLKNRLPAGIARSFVAYLRTGVSSAFQRPITDPGTDMLGLHVLIARTEMRPELSSHGLTFNRLLFTRAASLRAGMPATVQACFAHAEALWLLDGTLVTNARHGVAATATGDFDTAHTRTTRASMTDLLAWMATRQALATRFETVGDRVLAGCSWRISGNLRQRRLTTGAVKHHIR